jgi:hypothetical protein
MFKIILAIIFVFTIPNRPYCFDSKEHVEISNKAFMVALKRAYDTGDIDKDQAVLLIKCFADMDAIKGAKKIGLISEQEKVMLDLCVGEKKHRSYGDWSAMVDDVIETSQFVELYGQDIDADYGLDCCKTRKLFLKKEIPWVRKQVAARVNEHHFQGRTLTKFWEYHDLAQVYAGKKQLAFALILNAFAAHYLEDFFAPGHVRTPRTDVNNVGAKGIHDIVDRLGADITVKTRNNPELMLYLGLIRDIYGDPEGGVWRLSDLKEDGDMKLYGDGRLTKEKGQKELMIYEVAKSIKNIFNAYKTDKVSKPFSSNYEDEMVPGEELGPTYKSGHLYERINARFDDVSYKTKIRSYSAARNFLVFEGGPYLSTPLRKGVDTTWGGEIGAASYWAPYIGNGKGGLLQELGNVIFDTFLFGLGLGYDITADVNDYGVMGHGPYIKGILDIKNTGIGFSVYLKKKYNNENGHNYESVPFGVRMTYSADLFSFYVGVGSEPRFTDERIQNIVAIYTGFTVHYAWGWGF